MADRVHRSRAQRVARALREIALCCSRFGSQNLNGEWRILRFNDPLGPLPQLPRIRIVVEEPA